MSRNLQHLPQTYVVAWDNLRIVKAGYTGLNRWRAFVLRGGRLVHLYRLPTAREALDLEARFERVLIANGKQAFTSASDARPLLGSSGGGYLECFALPEHCYEHVLAALNEHVPDSAVELDPLWRSEHHAPSLTTDVTDVLTKRVVPRDRSLAKRNARERRGILPVNVTACALARCARGAATNRTEQG